MNDKVTLQAISDIFASQYGLSKKTTEVFGKCFFDTIVDGLNQEGIVKIKGLGTFKVVEVGSRESINVTNGERIVIEGYRKVSFTPDEFVEQKQAEAIELVETTVAAAVEQAVAAEAEIPVVESQAEEESAKIEEVVASSADTVELDKVEVPADSFSGIDMLISTPESVLEVEKDLECARIRAEQTLEEAKKANVEYRRLEILLERLKNNLVPESADTQQSAESTSVPLAAAVVEDEAISEPLPEPIENEQLASTDDQPSETCEQSSAEKENVEDTVAEEQPISQDETKDATKQNLVEADNEKPVLKPGGYEYDEDDEEEEDHRHLWILIPLVGILLAAVAIFAYRWMTYQVPSYEATITAPADSVKNDSANNKATNKVVDAEIKDDNKQVEDSKLKQETVNAEAEKVSAEKTASEKTASEKANADKAATDKAAADKKPKTHTMLKGENLYQISRNYYGTKDSVNAIIRINKFPDPNNVPIGQVIKLP